MQTVFNLIPDVMVSAKLVEMASQYPDLSRVEFIGRVYTSEPAHVSLHAMAWYGEGADSVCVTRIASNVEDLLSSFKQSLQIHFPEGFSPSLIKEVA